MKILSTFQVCSSYGLRVNVINDNSVIRTSLATPGLLMNFRKHLLCIFFFFFSVSSSLCTLYFVFCSLNTIVCCRQSLPPVGIFAASSGPLEQVLEGGGQSSGGKRTE